MKSPDQLREEEEKRKSDFFQLTAKSQIQQQRSPKNEEKKPEPPKPPQPPNPPTVPQFQKPVTPVSQPINQPKK